MLGMGQKGWRPHPGHPASSSLGAGGTSWAICIFSKGSARWKSHEKPHPVQLLISHPSSILHLHPSFPIAAPQPPQTLLLWHQSLPVPPRDQNLSVCPQIVRVWSPLPAPQGWGHPGNDGHTRQPRDPSSSPQAMPRAQGTHAGHQHGLHHPGCPQGWAEVWMRLFQMPSAAAQPHPATPDKHSWIRLHHRRQSPAAGAGVPGQGSPPSRAGEEPDLQGKHLCQPEPADGVEGLVLIVPQPCQPPCPHPAPGSDELRGHEPAHRVLSCFTSWQRCWNLSRQICPSCGPAPAWQHPPPGDHVLSCLLPLPPSCSCIPNQSLAME